MKIILILLLLVSSHSFAGEKEYLLKVCKDSGSAQTCNDCEVRGKASFKVSKSLASVLMTFRWIENGKDTDHFGPPVVYTNCKIFDDENWVCEEVGKEEEIGDTLFKADHEKRYLSHGLFISSYISGEVIRRNHIFEPVHEDYACATEIKSLLNWLK